MKHMHRNILYFTTLLFTGTIFFSFAQAQEEFYRIEHKDVFGKLRRPAIDFAHEDHVDALEETGCGACHHTPDETSGKLVYIEDEEVSCSECHTAKKDGDTPALREAFHGSCNGCHRQMIKKTENFKGPTTCGECHVPAKAQKND